MPRVRLNVHVPSVAADLASTEARNRRRQPLGSGATGIDDELPPRTLNRTVEAAPATFTSNFEAIRLARPVSLKAIPVT
jgi:hypothetical protein